MWQVSICNLFVDVLVRLGLDDVNVGQPQTGDNPLHTTSVVMLLYLQYHAQVDAQNKDGDTPLIHVNGCGQWVNKKYSWLLGCNVGRMSTKNYC